MGRTWKSFARICMFTLQWISVIRALCVVRPQVFQLAKPLQIGKNIKDAVVLGWSRQIFENSSKTQLLSVKHKTRLIWTSPLISTCRTRSISRVFLALALNTPNIYFSIFQPSTSQASSLQVNTASEHNAVLESSKTPYFICLPIVHTSIKKKQRKKKK